MEQKIPKIIHYCWFGNNPKPALIQQCIESWKKHCPDFEIIEWNESNFDVHSNAFVEEAYQAKKWAFVSDFARGYALLQWGGIYIDTDVELLQPIDSLLLHPFFAGFETKDSLGSAIFGCGKDNEIIRMYFEYYNSLQYSSIDKGYVIITSPIVLTELLKDKGLILNGKKQEICECTVYPKAVFYPTDIGWVFDRYGSKTIGVHHYLDSWGKNTKMGVRTKSSKLRLSLLFHARNLFGTDLMCKIGSKLRKKKNN